MENITIRKAKIEDIVQIKQIAGADFIKKLKIDLITTSRPDLSTITCQYGFLVGAREDMLHRYECVDFMDWNFHDQKITQSRLLRYLLYARKFRPRYAVAPDIYHEKQLDLILDFANELNKYAENVIIVPKAPVIDRIEKKYVLGFSVPSEYGETQLPIWEFYEHRVHLLGGSPFQQAYYYKLLPKVISVDGNSIWKAANRFCKYFTKSGWQHLYGCFITDKIIEAYKRSLINLKMFWLEEVDSDG